MPSEEQAADDALLERVERLVELHPRPPFGIDVDAVGEEFRGQGRLELVGRRVPLLLLGILLEVAQPVAERATSGSRRTGLAAELRSAWASTPALATSSS